MFMTEDLKNQLDDHLRITLPDHAKRILSERREVVYYEILRRVGRIQLSDHAYSNGSRWAVERTVNCDHDDAIEYKRLVAEDIGIHSCHLLLQRKPAVLGESVCNQRSSLTASNV